MIEVTRRLGPRLHSSGPLVVGAVETMLVPRPGVLVTMSTLAGAAPPRSSAA